jgi:branched-chain amino acid transport system ATP-binding protein
MSMLEVRHVILHFRGVAALSDVTFTVEPASIHAIIGPNGAGKTSMLNCVSGVYRPQRGSIKFKGEEMLGLAPSRRTKLGLARTFQNIALFRGMTVLDNLLIGRHLHQHAGVLAGGVYWGFGQREEIEHRRLVEDVIDFLEIQHLRKRVVGTLAYGLQKRVELARALALAPDLLLLDEPMAGMDLAESAQIVALLRTLRPEATLLLVEHDMDAVFQLADRISVLVHGRVIATGAPGEIRANDEVRRAYLGESHAP